MIGGGASGVLTAVHLLASSADRRLRVTVHEADGIVGRGVAYGTDDAGHLLNVRARHMSAYPDVPSDLLEWAARTGRNHDPQAFLPRRDYAAYLQDTLASVADHRLSISAGRVEDVVRTGPTFEVRTPGTSTRATAVVLAYGNRAPRPLEVDGDELPPAAWHLPDPWDLGALRSLRPDAVVVVVGTGLTAVDTAITLLEGAPARRVVMTSRHALLPHPHVEQQSTAWVSPALEGELTAQRLADNVCDQIAAATRQGVGWRAVIDGLRAPTQSWWWRLPLDERRRFLTTYARRWEVRRHRMAPEVAARVSSYRAQGRLTLLAGGITAIADRGAHCVVSVGPLGVPVTADAVVNCTGPRTDITRSPDPLLLALRERGLVAPDPLLLGIAGTAEGEVTDEAGLVVPGLYAVGPPRKGTLWESTAIPEIRAQAAQVARTAPPTARSGRLVT